MFYFRLNRNAVEKVDENEKAPEEEEEDRKEDDARPAAEAPREQREDQGSGVLLIKKPKVVRPSFSKKKQSEFSQLRRWEIRIANISIENTYIEAFDPFIEFVIGGDFHVTQRQFKGRTENIYQGEMGYSKKTEVSRFLDQKERRNLNTRIVHEYIGSYFDIQEQNLRIEVWDWEKWTFNRFMAREEIPLMEFAQGQIYQEFELMKIGEKKQTKLCNIRFTITFQEIWDYLLFFSDWSCFGIELGGAKPDHSIRIKINKQSVDSGRQKGEPNPQWALIKENILLRGSRNEIDNSFMTVELYQGRTRIGTKTIDMNGVIDAGVNIKMPITYLERSEQYCNIKGRVSVQKHPRFKQRGELMILRSDQQYLFVKILRVENVILPQDRGMINTFLDIQWGSYRKTTRTVYDSALPIFNEDFFFPIVVNDKSELLDIVGLKKEGSRRDKLIQDELRKNCSIDMNFWAIDEKNCNECLGFISFNLSELQNAKVYEVAFYDEKKQGESFMKVRKWSDCKDLDLYQTMSGEVSKVYFEICLLYDNEKMIDFEELGHERKKQTTNLYIQQKEDWNTVRNMLIDSFTAEEQREFKKNEMDEKKQKHLLPCYLTKMTYDNSKNNDIIPESDEDVSEDESDAEATTDKNKTKKDKKKKKDKKESEDKDEEKSNEQEEQKASDNTKKKFSETVIEEDKEENGTSKKNEKKSSKKKEKKEKKEKKSKKEKNEKKSKKKGLQNIINELKHPGSQNKKKKKNDEIPTIDTLKEITYYVSLIPFSSNRDDIWASPELFLRMGKGDSEEHSILLANLFMGAIFEDEEDRKRANGGPPVHENTIEKRTFVCVGSLHESKTKHSWVMTFSKDFKHVYFWESTTAQCFELKNRVKDKDKLKKFLEGKQVTGHVHEFHDKSAKPSDNLPEFLNKSEEEDSEENEKDDSSNSREDEEGEDANKDDKGNVIGMDDLDPKERRFKNMDLKRFAPPDNKKMEAPVRKENMFLKNKKEQEKFSDNVDLIVQDPYQHKENSFIPYRTIDVIFNTQNMFMNRQYFDPNKICYDIYDEQTWHPFFSQNFTETDKEKFPSSFYSPPLFAPEMDATRAEQLKERLLKEIKSEIIAYRSGKNLSNFWKNKNDKIVKEMEKYLNYIEEEASGKLGVEASKKKKNKWSKFMRQYMPENYRLRAVDSHFNYPEPDRIASVIKKENSSFFKIDKPFMKWALAVKIFRYLGGVLSIRVLVISIFRIPEEEINIQD